MGSIGQRIHVVGTSGSGKTTLAGILSRRLGIPHVELDAIHWLPGWTERSREETRAMVAKRLEADAWIVDGNYRSTAQDLIWPRVQTIVWLNLSRTTVMRQVIGRTLRRLVTREELWSGNRESLRMALSRESIVWWAWSTHAGRREHYRVSLREVDARVVELRSRAEVDGWVDGLDRA